MPCLPAYAFVLRILKSFSSKKMKRKSKTKKIPKKKKRVDRCSPKLWETPLFIKSTLGSKHLYLLTTRGCSAEHTSSTRFLVSN